jgi:lipoprotein NlpD
MKTVYQTIVLGLLIAILGGCASHSRAPIDSRNNQQGAGAKTTSKSSAAAKSAQPDYYVVQGGDTLYSIAWELGVNYRELASTNAIRSPYTIYKGQRLRVKPAANKSVAKPVALQSRPAVTASSASATAPAAKAVAKPVSKPAPSQAPAPKTASKPVAAAPAKSTAQAYDGKWVWPTRGRVLSRFQSSGAGKQGIDIGGHVDQPVKAAAHGKVVYAGSGLVGYGRLIIVKHNENLLSAYGHNNKLLVNEGEQVSAGQMIAKMGSSGTNRNELYFEIRKNGKPTDPLKYLPKQ